MMNTFLPTSKLLLCTLAIVFSNVLSAQNTPKPHIVKDEETLSSISKLYGVSQESILKLNPDIRDGKIKKNMTLIIPADKTSKPEATPNAEQANTFSHIVSSGESLNDVANRYDLDEEVIKAFNPSIGNRQKLKRGIVLEIPLTQSPKDQRKRVSPEDINHIIEKGETLWSISRAYNLTVQELKALNPNLEGEIKMGDTLVVSGQVASGSSQEKPKANINQEKHDTYIVREKETLYAISKRFEVPIETITNINPEISERGLYVGMVLKIPRAGSSPLETKPNETKAQKETSRSRAKSNKQIRMALVLPLQLSKIDIDLPREEVKKSLAPIKLMNYSLDFYFGVMSAIDSLKSKGLYLDLKVVDSDARRSAIKEEISKGTFDNIDVVLGPFYPDPFNELSAFLEEKNIPIIAPLSTKEIVQRSNTVLTVPKDDILREKFLDYVLKNVNDEKVLIIADKENTKSTDAIKSVLSNAVSIDLSTSEERVDMEALRALIDPVAMNIVFLETSKVSLMSNVVSILNSLVSEHCQIQLFTTYRSNNYDNNISNQHLSNLKFTYPVINRYSLKNKTFIDTFIAEYGAYPNKYTIRGYDITYDLLSRMMADKDWYDRLDKTETEFLESRFQYVSASGELGYTNEGVYIMRYNKLDLEELE